MPPTRLSIPRRPARPRRPVAQAVRVLGVAALGVALTACGGAQADPQSDRAPSASASATESGTPRYVEMGLAEAASKAAKAGYTTRHHNASGSEQADSWLVGDWRVCFQKESAPASGEGKPELEFGAVPSGVSCPSKAAAALDWPEFPDVVGSSHQDATAEIGKLGLRDVSARSAYSNVELPSAPDKWKVCFQEPGAGTEAPFADDLAVRLDLVAPRTDCPKKTGTRLPPAPKPTPPPAPKPTPATSAPQTPDGSTGGSTGTSGGSTGGGSTGGTTGGTSSGGSTTGGSTSGGQAGVHPGSFCSTPGAIGSTTKGTPMRCTTTATDDRYRWRAA